MLTTALHDDLLMTKETFLSKNMFATMTACYFYQTVPFDGLNAN